MNKRLNLAKRIALGAGLALAGLTGLCYDSHKTANKPLNEAGTEYSSPSHLEEKLTPADKVFNEFPSEIPGAYSIEKKHQANGSKYCLAHILQRHLPPSESYPGVTSKNAPPEFRLAYFKECQKANAVQKGIYNILNFLAEKNEVSEVRHEGSIKGMSQEEADAFYRKMLGHILQNSLPSGEAIKQTLADKEMMERDFRYAPNGAILLAMEGKIKILPAEKEETRKKTSEEYLATRQVSLATQNQREDDLLELASQSENPLQVLVYGGAHDWMDNIKAWNERYPDRKFSYLVITPNAFKILNAARTASEENK